MLYLICTMGCDHVVLCDYIESASWNITLLDLICIMTLLLRLIQVMEHNPVMLIQVHIMAHVLDLHHGT